MMEKQWLVGIDIGGTSIKLAFLTDQGEVLHKWEIATNKANQGSGIIDEIAASVHAKLDELNLPHSILSGAGVGAPGPVDVNEGLLFEAVNIGWEDRFPLRDLLQNALKIPVAIENDANSAALGEMWKGAGNGAKDLICITLGTGVGEASLSMGTLSMAVKALQERLAMLPLLQMMDIYVIAERKAVWRPLLPRQESSDQQLKKLAAMMENQSLKKYMKEKGNSRRKIFLTQQTWEMP